MHFNLKDYPTSPPDNWNKEDTKEDIQLIKEKITEEVLKLHASQNKAVLVILQGIDASGKDGTTWEVFSGLSPDWVNVASFKKPNEQELAHDYLWRIHQQIPEKGKIGVFNRSHYEDILVPTVYKYIEEETIQRRYEEINNFEKYLSENGVFIIKLFLHISKSRQKEKLIERITIPEKQYKHSDDDWSTREKWNDFMDTYESIISKCNNPIWHIIPADSSTYRNYIVSRIVLKKLKELNLSYPPLKSEKFNEDTF